MSHKKRNPGAAATATGAKSRTAAKRPTLSKNPTAEQGALRRPFFVLGADPDDPECTPLLELMALLDAGQLPHFAARWGRRNGDCHEIAQLLFHDLVAARGRHRWAWSIGVTALWGEHSWLECDGWVLDAAHGKTRPVLVMRQAAYQRFCGCDDLWFPDEEIARDGASC
jgi:hypothetical protein